MNRPSSLLVLAAAAVATAAPAANAQVLIPTNQIREIRGQGTWTDPGGTTMSTGPLSNASFPGDFGFWFGTLSIPGFIAGSATQVGGFDGLDTITLETMSLNLGGGNGPGTSAAASLEMEFTFSFDIPSTVTYVSDAVFAVAPPSAIPDTSVEFHGVYVLSGPSGEVFRHETTIENGHSVAVVGATGTLPPGSYTLSFVAGGEVSFVAPPGSSGNGAGGGAGGPSPLLNIRFIPFECAADWNNDGTVNSSDISAFITSWLSSLQNGDLNADFNGDSVVNSSDISAFIGAWLSALQNGCP